jgi:NAD(P)-dependent dehydrogenase (short-subunit alcohol dehydrogenase family)
MTHTGGGSIINMSSVSGLRGCGENDSIPYSTSKGAIVTLTQTMAVQHGRDNIRVNAIAPGLIYTPMVSGQMTTELRDLRTRAAPLGTEGTAWDIALASLFLASEESRWITGVVLPVDAGLIRTTPLSGLHYH